MFPLNIFEQYMKPTWSYFRKSQRAGVLLQRIVSISYEGTFLGVQSWLRFLEL